MVISNKSLTFANEINKTISVMEKVRFVSRIIPEVFYEVVREKWMDINTYLVVFQTKTNVDGVDFHMEAEYHKDENKVYYSRCYSNEVLDGSQYISPIFKQQIEEYISKKVGILREGSFMHKRKIQAELTLDIPKGVTMGELYEWIGELTIEVKSPKSDFIKVIDVKNVV